MAFLIVASLFLCLGGFGVHLGLGGGNLLGNRRVCNWFFW